MTPEALPPELLALGRRQAMVAGETVFRRDGVADGVFRVESGAVRLVRFGRHGEEVVLHEARAGEFFAEASIDARRYHCDARVTSPGILLRIPAEPLRDLLASDAALANQWASLLARQLRAARMRLERLSLKSAADRIRHLLVSEGHGPHHEIAIGGALKDLAPRLGLSHESLYRTLARMEAAGEIERASGHLRLRR